MAREFAMKDLGPIHHFLGISVTRLASGLHLSQRQYILDILSHAGMRDCHSVTTPIDTNAKLPSSTGPPVPDPSLYRSLAGALQYATLTRPDIAYAVQQVCLHMHDPREPHFSLIKRILRYLNGTLDHGLPLHRTSTHSLTAYSDADWAGCPDTRRSTSGFCMYLGDNLVSWSARRQTTVSRSSAESCWVRQLLQELHRPISTATIVYCDNVSAVYLSANPVHHRRMKHIELDIHSVREKVALGAVRVLHVPSALQFADIFTKGLPTALFRDFRSSLQVTPVPGSDCGGVLETY